MMQQQMRKEEERQQLIAAKKEAVKPVLMELRQAGFDIEAVSDLYNRRFDYREAIPILLQWLPNIENPNVKEDIVRALSVPWAKKTAASALLVEEYRKAGNNFYLKWAIGNALSVVADDEVLDDIIELVRVRENGKAREMLVIALGNMKSHEVIDLLIELLEEGNLAGFAIMALGKLKSKEARSAIEPFLTHPKTWIRREAKKALKRIDK